MENEVEACRQQFQAANVVAEEGERRKRARKEKNIHRGHHQCNPDKKKSLSLMYEFVISEFGDPQSAIKNSLLHLSFSHD